MKIKINITWSLAIGLVILASSFRFSSGDNKRNYFYCDSPVRDTLFTGYNNVIKVKNTGSIPFSDLILTGENVTVSRDDEKKIFNLKVAAAAVGKKIILSLKNKEKLLESRSFQIAIMTVEMACRLKKFNETKK